MGEAEATGRSVASGGREALLRRRVLAAQGRTLISWRP